ncbi:MAG: hypothetical protein AB1489_14240, partial [Acidobacteriota bacterium]
RTLLAWQKRQRERIEAFFNYIEDWIAQRIRAALEPIVLPIQNYFARIEAQLTPYNRRWPLLGLLCIVISVYGIVSVIMGLYNNPAISLYALLGKQSSARIRFKWQPIENLLASTAADREAVARELNIDKGEYIVALFSISCGDCEREAIRLKLLNNKDKLIVLAAAPSQDVAQWRASLKLDYQVIPITDKQLESLGGVILPTFIHLKDGKAIEAAESTEVRR